MSQIMKQISMIALFLYLKKNDCSSMKPSSSFQDTPHRHQTRLSAVSTVNDIDLIDVPSQINAPFW